MDEPLITFTKVRNDWIERHGMTPTERLVGMWLYGRMRRDRIPWQVDVDQIAGALGITVYATKKAVKTLKAKGMLTDNSKPEFDPRTGQWAQPRSRVIDSRRAVVVAPDLASSQVGPRAGFPTSVNLPPNELLSDERLSVSGPAQEQATSAELAEYEPARQATPVAQGRSPSDHDLALVNSTATENLSASADASTYPVDLDEFKRESRKRRESREAKAERGERARWRGELS